MVAGEQRGGFDDIVEAANCMAKTKDTIYVPKEVNIKAYDVLYSEYLKLYDYFGRENTVIKTLKDI